MNMVLLSVNWSHVWLVTGVGFVLVFVLLIILTYLLQLMGKLFGVIDNSKKKVNATVDNPAKPAAQSSIDDDTDMAAIAMALHLYYNSVHDNEPTRITIKRVQQNSSPWNNKSFGMNNLHR